MHAKCSITVNAPRERVIAVLLDAHAYPRWVVGARAIRDVDDGWPKAQTSFHHRSGAGPVEIKDRTTMLETDNRSFVRLRARAWPMGEAEVRISVKGRGQRSEVVLEEMGKRGLARAFATPMLVPALHMRNMLALRKLKELIEAERVAEA